MALNAIIIISWTRKGQLSMQEWSEGVSDKEQHTVIEAGEKWSSWWGYTSRGHFTGQEKQIAGMYHNEGKKRERAAVYSSRHMWKGGKYGQAPSACKCLLEPRGKAQKGNENWSHQQFHHPAGECQSIWSITCVCRLCPDQFSRFLKSLLLIKEG